VRNSLETKNVVLCEPMFRRITSSPYSGQKNLRARNQREQVAICVHDEANKHEKLLSTLVQFGNSVPYIISIIQTVSILKFSNIILKVSQRRHICNY
jgi:hypothetical protein